jgi:hypothetical protein
LGKKSIKKKAPAPEWVAGRSAALAEADPTLPFEL